MPLGSLTVDPCPIRTSLSPVVWSSESPLYRTTVTPRKSRSTAGMWPPLATAPSVPWWAILTELLLLLLLLLTLLPWKDMNEPSNLWSRSHHSCQQNNLERPPFLPPVVRDSLFCHTVCMSARHYIGLHYNLHNLYGLSETSATNASLQ
ncbi:lysosomal alpha-glucosidase-like isoform X2 [Eriocheir sinensis]|uniref:lysosomal alpha-glucosidase-like isoform X2 n=1 Tax=Eriocheir sinensis TaxID=95602 RepID=UPI0021C64941|nr:lysosomal alpha-glucosidase-like isoform X2 [Eriocheir sinensis]